MDSHAVPEDAMNRRGFLHAMLATGAAPAIVKAANIMPIFARRESGLFVPSGMDLIRETMAFDIYENATLVRMDVLIGATQWGVDGRIFEGPDAAQHLREFRELGKRMLDNEIRHAGISWDEARPLQTLERPVQIVKAP